MVVQALAANAAILFGLALILAVFAPRIAGSEMAWGGGIVVLAGASWFQLAAPAPLAGQIAAMAAAWGLCVVVAHWIAGRRVRSLGFSRPDEARSMMQAVLHTLARAALLFVVASPVQYGIIQASSIEPVSGLSLVGLAIFAIGFVLDILRARRAKGAKWGAALVWWGLWIAAASAGWWVAAWTAIGPILATYLVWRHRGEG